MSMLLARKRLARLLDLGWRGEDAAFRLAGDLLDAPLLARPLGSLFFLDGDGDPPVLAADAPACKAEPMDSVSAAARKNLDGDSPDANCNGNGPASSSEAPCARPTGSWNPTMIFFCK